MNAPSLHAAGRASTLPAPPLKAPGPPGGAPDLETAPLPAARGRVRIEGLDCLRLFAALSVLLYHYAWRGAAADDLTRVSLPALQPVAQYGFLGVDLFFVLSGFVIAGSAEGRTWRQFSVARFARIYPSFVFCMTATFAVTALLGRPPIEASLSQWAANLLVVSPALGVPWMDGVYWSIFYEIVFYGWLALLIAGGLFPSRARLILALWLSLSMLNELAIGSNVLRKLFLTDHSGFFAAGVALYLIRRGGRSSLNCSLLGLSALVAVCQLTIATDYVRNHFRVEMNNVVLIVGALGMIAIVAFGTTIRDVKLPPGVVAAIGGLTYPLYLLHQNAGYILFNRLDGRLPAPAIVALTTAVMLAAAWTVWRFVERPSRRAILRLTDRVSAPGPETLHRR